MPRRAPGIPILTKTGARAALSLGLLGAPSAAGVLFFDPTLPNTVPDRLSATGIYADIAAKTPDTALRFFEVNASLWSDGAKKSRWLILPPGTRVPYVDGTDRFDYPDGARFVKLFRLERVRGDASTLVHWETRMLVNKKDAQGNDVWHGFTWRWNADATEAWRVHSGTGLDTVFLDFPRGLARPQGYRKWHFPNQGECRVCHQSWQGETETGFKRARAVLGFFPAQLKRPLPGAGGAGGGDQIDALFDNGTFSGPRPDAAAKRRRWKGLEEGIPAGLSSEARFRALDTLARSYIAANCSGCHGDAGVHATPQIPGALNYDFLHLRPEMDFAAAPVGDWNLKSSSGDPLEDGRARYVDAVARAGLDTAAGAAWNMRLPSAHTEAGLVAPGHPALSVLLYRMTARPTPERDSLAMRRRLAAADAKGWAAWIFLDPWGSAPWRERLAGHGVPIDSVVQYAYDNQQMPRLASYLPDTSALAVLGEWVRAYRTLPASLGGSGRRRTGAGALGGTGGAPVVQGRVLRLPHSWDLGGKENNVTLRDAAGRDVPLVSAGRRTFVLPADASAGVYLGTAGGRSFRLLLP